MKRYLAIAIGLAFLALPGGAHSNAFARLYQASGMTGAAPSRNGFALATGGGLDVCVSQHIAVRPVRNDSVTTRFSNPFTGTNNRNNFRYQAGIVFVVGEK